MSFLFLNSSFVNAIGWTLLHSLWQGVLAMIIILFILSVTRKSNPVIRYNLLLSVFALLMISMFVTFFMQLDSTNTVYGETSSAAAVDQTYASADASPGMVAVQTNKFISGLEYFMDGYSIVLVTIWFVIFCIQCMRLGVSLENIYHLRSCRTVAASTFWQYHCSMLKDKLKIRRPVFLWESEMIKVPVAIGFLKPLILVPAGLLANIPAGQVESILLHELAHIKRGDYLVNILQSVAECIFFFNPAILWISSVIREERETCCDEIAVKQLGSKTTYIEALVAFQKYDKELSPAMTAFPGRKNHLLQRVKRIIYNENKKLGIMEKLIAFSGLITIALISVLATTPHNEAKKTETPVISHLPIVTDTVPDKNDNEEIEIEDAKDQQDEPIIEIKEDKKQKQLTEKQRKQQKKELEKLQESAKATEAEMKQLQLKLNELSKLQQQKMSALHEKLSASGALSKIDQEELERDIREATEDLQNDNLELQKDLAEANIERQIEQSEQLAQLDEQLAKLDQQNYLSQIDLEKIKEVNKAMAQRQRAVVDSVMRIHARVNTNIIIGERNVAEEVLDFLMEKNIIKTKRDVKFTLNNNELVVNGNKQPADVHLQFRQRFLHGKNDSIIFSRSGGSTHSVINIESTP